MISPSFDATTKSEIARIEQIFDDANATWVEAHTLLKAEVMLDVYGEAIRDRAYIVHDPVDGDYVLRPDFTVPIVETHMKHGAEPARYAYSGRVWRKRRDDHGKHSFWQMGFELFDRGVVAQNDASMFALAQNVAKDLPVKTGDLSLIFSILETIDLPEWRKSALSRHVWRPRAFSRLLERYSQAGPKYSDLDIGDLPVHGKRDRDMIEARIARLNDDAKAKPLDPHLKSIIDKALAVKGSLRDASKQFQSLAKEFQPLTNFSESFEHRLDAMADARIAIDHVMFDAELGRENMEYYDGFVFEFGERAVVGGRYDGLTSLLGDGEKIPAIGFACRLDRLEGRA